MRHGCSVVGGRRTIWNLFYNSPMESCIVICNRKKVAARKGKVIFIDAVNEVTRERAQSFLKPEHQQRILTAYKTFADVPGFAKVATLAEIGANAGNLSIPLYVKRIAAAIATDSNGDAVSLRSAWDQWQTDGRAFWQQMDALVLAQDVRKIIITTIFKFGEATGSLNDRSNIIALVDEAHRTQEGDLGRKMREALPNAFLFGLTGTPINRADRNTFYAFGADEDEKGYMSRYGFEESIRDGATLKLHFEPRLIDLHIDKAALDAAYKDLTGGLSDLDKDNLAKTAAKMAVLVKTPERIRKVCEDIVEHFQTKVEPNGFKGQIVTFDRESCLLFKAELDKLLPPEATDIVMSVQAADKKEHPEYAPYDRSRDEEERLLDRFRDPADPLKLIIVTAKLLTGFDAPILQAMYLDKPLRDHTLLQAICRVNRTYSEQKTHGLIVDYLGIFDDVAAALEFDDQSVKQVVSNIQELKDKLPDPKKAKEIEIKLKRRLRGHGGNPKFKKLSERLDALKDRFESGQINSVEFLKQLLEIAKETLQAEKEVPPEEDEDRGKAALTELFNEVKTAETPIMVERVVADIDEIVRLVRFPGWQGTQAGEREVKKALRKALFKYKLHADEELFEKAYSYIRQYY